MPRTTPLAERRTELDRRLDAALASTDETDLELARAGVLSVPDRWYGQLLALSHDAVVDERSAGGTASPRTDVVLPASTAVELLRGYCRLRGELFAQLGNDDADPTTRDPGPVLLAGDYLNSAAYAVLGSLDHPRLDDAFGTLLSVSESLACAFDARHGDARHGDTPDTLRHRDPTDAPGSFLDETAGSLGAGAAVIGAVLGDADESTRERFATLGSGFSTARQIQQLLATDAETVAIAPPDPDADRLREYGASRVDAASGALDDLAATADVGALRDFVADTLTGFDPTA